MTDRTWHGFIDGIGPASCGADHYLEPGTYQRSWTPCICPPALATGRNGHDTWRCLVCETAGVTAVFYSPPHEDGTGSLASPA